MELHEPIEATQRRLLRQAVLEHIGSLTGRAFPPVLHVGTPGGSVRRFTLRADEPTDHALRADIVAGMLGRGPGVRRTPPWVWLARTGDLALHDLDVAWLGAATTAYAEAGVDLTMVVVTRRGWRDPRTGAGRTWVRLRA